MDMWGLGAIFGELLKRGNYIGKSPVPMLKVRAGIAVIPQAILNMTGQGGGGAAMRRRLPSDSLKEHTRSRTIESNPPSYVFVRFAAYSAPRLVQTSRRLQINPSSGRPSFLNHDCRDACHPQRGRVLHRPSGENKSLNTVAFLHCNSQLSI